MKTDPVLGILLGIIAFIFFVPKKQKKTKLTLHKGGKDSDRKVQPQVMTKIICYICDYNLALKEYKGPKYLDEDGSKPCLECLTELEAEDEQNEEENGV